MSELIKPEASSTNHIPIGHHVAPNRKNEIGKTFGRLYVVSYAGKTSNRGISYNCLCVCGNHKIVSGECLRSGDTKSCGCLQRERPSGEANPAYIHGYRRTKTYQTWCGMIQRCTNSENPKFKRYGGRGITICDRWTNFVNFLQDMGVKPVGKTLGRINNNGNYDPDNCRWETPSQQANNRVNNHLLTFQGKTNTVAQWSRTCCY